MTSRDQKVFTVIAALAVVLTLMAAVAVVVWGHGGPVLQ
jgi:hypothetical protein